MCMRDQDVSESLLTPKLAFIMHNIVLRLHTQTNQQKFTNARLFIFNLADVIVGTGGIPELYTPRLRMHTHTDEDFWLKFSSPLSCAALKDAKDVFEGSGYSTWQENFHVHAHSCGDLQTFTC